MLSLVRALPLTALALGWCGPVLAAAEAEAEPTATDIVVTAEREQDYKPNAQSTALFGSQSVLDTPFSVNSLSAELIRDQQARTLTDITRNDPSVVTTGANTGFFDSVAIRGFTLGNSGSYYRDGLWYQNQVQAPIENKASVEILKGLSAIRFGFTAPGGIINYTVKQPGPTPVRSIELFGNGFGGVGVHVDLGGMIDERLGIRVNGVVAQDELFVRDVGGPRQMISGFVSWEALDNLRIDLEAEYQYLELEQQAVIGVTSFAANLSRPQVQGLLDRFDPRTYLGQAWTTYPTRNFVGSARLTWDFAPNWRIKAAVQKMDLLRDQNAISIAPRSVQANGDFTANLFFAPNQRRDPLSAQAWVEGTFETAGIAHEVVAGVYHVNNRLTFPDGFFGPVGTSNLFAPRVIENPRLTSDPSYTGARERQLAFYATDYLRITHWLNLFVGGRYTKPIFETFDGPDQPPSQRYDESAFTPSFGLVVKPAESVSIYASYAEGLEQGGTAPITAVNANEQLAPRLSEQWELGVKAELLRDALLTAAVFQIDRALELVDDTNRFVQDGLQRHRGAEVTLQGSLTTRLRAVTGATYLDARVERAANQALNGRRPINVPEWQANAFLDWQLPFSDALWVNGGIYHTSSRFLDNLNTFQVAAQTRFDIGARARFELGQTRFTGRLIVENVGNERLIAGAAGNFTFGAPRTVRLALTADF